MSARQGKDAYTGEKLDWTLIGSYANDASKEQKRKYKHTSRYSSTIDHVSDGLGLADFRICSWRTSDAKHDLTEVQFLDLCRAVLDHHGFAVIAR